MTADRLSREEVVAFLGGQRDTPEDLEALSGGAWSSAWAYRAGGEELVVRFGPQVSWYEADRMAMAFTGPDLPVPEVREVGTAPSGRAYAISVRHHGRFLEDTPVEQAGAIAPTLTRLLVALYRVPAGPDTPVVWHQGAASVASWREYLLDDLVDDPGKLVRGWSAALAGDRELAALSAAVTERVRTLVEACPERRDLVHGDLLHGNVLVSPDGRRVEAVLSWKCSVRGDFLFDAAWCSFWAPLLPGDRRRRPPVRRCSGPRACGPSPAPSSTPRPATTATSCISASPIWAGTCGPGTRLISPLPPGVSPKSSSAARCLWLAIDPHRDMHGVQGLVDDTGQVIADGVELDGSFEPGRERGHGLVRVVLDPVEPPVHRPTPILTGGAASPASSSLLVAVLVWPVAIASWKRQVRRA